MATEREAEAGRRQGQELFGHVGRPVLKTKAKKAMQELWWWQSLDCHRKDASTLGEGVRKTAGQALEWRMQSFRSKDSNKSFSQGVLF